MLAGSQFPAARCQPFVQRLEVGEPRQRREQPLADVADLVLNLALLPARGRGAGDRLEQIVVGQDHEAAIKQSVLAGEDCIYNRVRLSYTMRCGTPPKKAKARLCASNTISWVSLG